MWLSESVEARKGRPRARSTKREGADPTVWAVCLPLPRGPSGCGMRLWPRAWFLLAGGAEGHRAHVMLGVGLRPRGLGAMQCWEWG